METFEMYRLDEEHVTLKTHNGHYLCAENGGGSLIVANRTEPKEWETFQISMDQNGLVAFKAHNGQYLCAEEYGILKANRDVPKMWEAFKLIDPTSVAVEEQTQIMVNVYKILIAPFWHTGTVIGEREYYFQTSNRIRKRGQSKVCVGRSSK
ncbi:hypothetical protein QP794_24330 [Paenibacillus sp. UMB7766-LJ446]|uniref:fascin domain-containing protein n=1 Tax=Paenibacillus sp. UMB7766-LJ446 TaxID=3046313 RepID=UPI00254F2993|nr:hypothetical protein [Paenibacillus sp. UMB7766-LJ446]MDK8193219.1 hypothetical protein [Paenibacillus sp. UMB7766-LJ446]